jgi:hypothetical protein
MRAIICLAAIRGSFEFGAKRGRPFGPGEMPLFREVHGEREHLRLRWLGKHGATGLTRQ